MKNEYQLDFAKLKTNAEKTLEKQINQNLTEPD